ncbi:hypothetical protein BsWGS_12885 [Bradybaena similaris]
MEITVDKSSTSNTATQTDFVNSPILWQCLYVLQNMPEFRNLAYRITKTWNEVEMIMVYREGVVAVFGPPVEPITLTLDPNGKCLLSIPFKPVQRVSIVSPESGHIEIASLLAVLRMVAGKGYLFCPGLPERFLAGKACGKFVVLHKVPFKRYQSLACPVYYQTRQQTSSKSSLCALCPRCMQAAKWIQSLPYFSANGTAKALQQPTQQAAAAQQLYQRNAVHDVSTKSSVVTQGASSHSPGYIFPPVSVCGLVTHGVMNSSSFTPVPEVSQILNLYQNNSSVKQETACIDVNGNSQLADVSNNNSCISGQSGNALGHQINPVNEKLLERKSFLRSLLQERSRNKFSAAENLKTEATGGEPSINTAFEQSDSKIKRGKQRPKNVCHYCKKTFSTPANLMNHFQRHEAVPGSWQKQFKERRLKKNHARTLSLMRVFFWRLKSLLFQHGKRPAYISETSLRLLLKYLDDLIPFQNGATALKQMSYSGIQQKITKAEKKNDFQTENEVLDNKFSLKRNSSGRYVMQTLLEAAAIAGADQEHVSSPTVSSSSSVIAGKNLEGAVVPTISQTPPTPIQIVEANVPEKRPRKSSKVTSKTLSNKNRKAKDKDVNETVVTNRAGNSANHSPLTNLNLLSDVSLQTAARAVSASYTSSFPSSCQLLLNNKSEINAPLIKEPKANSPLTSVNGSNSAAISHLPPLLFARTEPSTSASFLFPSQKQVQPQLMSPTSLLRHKTVNEKQPILSSCLVAAPAPAPRDAASPYSNCGAIDLSKPKPSQTITNVPLTVDKKQDMELDMAAFSGLFHNQAQMFTYKNPDIVPHLKTSIKAADATIQDHNETHPVTVGATSAKSAKPDLQLPSGNTRSYKGRKGVKNTAQLHTVIDTSIRSTIPGDSSSVQSDEIHCSYKWTGSGGMVKEHTQMVRELVPSHVMANFLSKPWLPSAVIQPLSVDLYNSSKSPILSPQIMMSSSEQLQPIKPHQFSATQAALNLSKSKLADAGVSGSSRRQTVMISTSVSPTANRTSASPSSSSMKSSNVNFSGITNCLPAHHPASTDAQDHPITSNPQKMQFKDMKKLHFSSSSSSLLAVHTSPSCTPLPSPSLSSVLSHQAADKHEYAPSSIIGSISHHGRSPSFLTNRIPTNSELSCSRNNHTKPEPVYSQNPEQGMFTMTVSVKEENVDPDVDHDQNRSVEASDRLPTNLVIDVSPDSTTSKDESMALNLGGHFISEQADLLSQKG